MVYRVRVNLRLENGYHSLGYKVYPDRYDSDSLNVFVGLTSAPSTVNQGIKGEEKRKVCDHPAVQAKLGGWGDCLAENLLDRREGRAL